jgi:hypothetical protein
MSIRTTFDVTMIAGTKKVVRVCAESAADAYDEAKRQRPDWFPIEVRWADPENESSEDSR